MNFNKYILVDTEHEMPSFQVKSKWYTPNLDNLQKRHYLQIVSTEMIIESDFEASNISNQMSKRDIYYSGETHNDDELISARR